MLFVASWMFSAGVVMRDFLAWLATCLAVVVGCAAVGTIAGTLTWFLILVLSRAMGWL